MKDYRAQKEIGAKIYEVILHIAAILSLLLAYDFSNEGGLIDMSKIWWAWFILTYMAVKRLYVLDLLKREARSCGIMLTQLTEELNKEAKKDD